MDRRTFLTGAATVATGAALAPTAEAAPRYRISLAQWSLHRALFGKQLDNLDFAKTASQDYGIYGLEYVNQFFKDKATDKAYLKELKKRSKDHGCHNGLIMCDGEGALGDPDAAKRQKAVENHYRWVEAAKYLGCHSIRVNAQSAGSYVDQMNLAAEGLRKLTEFGAEHDINVIVENHGGLSSNGTWLGGVMQKVNHPRCGTLPDFGNFGLGGGKTYNKYLGIQELMPYAKGVSAKSHVFNAAGDEEEIDYRQMLKIVDNAGYHGYIGIEYEGSKHSEPDGIKLTKKLIEKVLGEMGYEVGKR